MGADTRGQEIMTTRDLAMTTAGVVAMAAWVAASVTAWLLVTAPATVAMAINGRDAQSLVQLGLAIATAGLLFTLSNLHILRARDYLHYWPVVLVAIGLVHISQAKTTYGIVGGGIWILVGSAMLGNRLGFLDVNIWKLWPLILVLVGGRIVWQTLSVDAPGVRGVDTSSRVSAVAVMGGFDRKITSKEFQNGEITAFMGGGKLDLREAAPAGGQAVVNVFALMGGFEIIVPETWTVNEE